MTISFPYNILLALMIPVFTSVTGYFIVKKNMRLVAWLLFVINTAFIEWLTFYNSPPLRMFLIILSMFICMKIITVTESNKRKEVNLNMMQWLVFCFGWVGMRAEIFSETISGLQGGKQMILSGVTRIAVGMVLIFAAHKIFFFQSFTTGMVVLITVLLLIGFSLVLHFGVLAVSAGVWRLMGIKTYYLFNSPLRSNSLSEFWSKRWNIAFSEMTSLAIYRPFKNLLGTKGAFFAAFFFSGILHELAISLPVHQGFGLPLIYFILQTCVILLEDLLAKNNIIFFKKGIASKVWVYCWVIIPAPILFHQYFISGIIWPLAGLVFPG